MSPNFDEEVVAFTKKEGAVSFPGGMYTDRDLSGLQGRRDVIKLFPFVEIGGLDFLKAIRGPFPYMHYMLCGGAKLENISGYLAARATGILVGSAIIRRDLVEASDWPSITGIAVKFVAKAVEFSAGKVRCMTSQ